jgi:LysM repeat protein
MRSLLRPLGVIAIGLSPAILITACGNGDDETANTPVVPIQETSYVVKEPATTTTTLPADLAAEGGISAAAQVYTVVAGDAVYSIANKFDVDPVEMANFNDWPEGVNHFLAVGDVVNIPPGGRIPGAAVEDDETATDDTESDTTETDDTEADTDSTDAPPSGSGDDCEPGQYTITADDTTRLKVAEKFDVTVEALDAANVNTNGYAGFYPGLEIVIPCVAD